jgi:A/G-specific adenine glycosylase
MLQQTQVARVVERYAGFLDRFPTLASVAAASPAQLHEAWQGLGYYARARNLHALARELVGTRPGLKGDGAPEATLATLPDDPEMLRRLPGVGRYTAGAVASFAYERPAALVDTNVARVLTRAFAPRHDPRTAAGRRAAWAIAEHILPRSGTVAHTHNQALMELGALVCTARKPGCQRCPVRAQCKTGKKAGRR